ncbi:MAG: hypothetical protein ACJA1E_000688 [Paracoccaceae bacterium]|jgi:hypothetical protein
MTKRLMLCALCLTFGQAAVANEYAPAMNSYYEGHIMKWAGNPMLADAIKSQNMKTAGLAQSAIDELDLQWRAEVGTSTQTLITPVLTGPVADFLRVQVEASGGAITEVFAMDARGLNVAASDVTSDYWQGDESKFSETFPKGAGAVHFSEIEFDESSQTYQGQISFVITDPETSTPIGAITIGVNAEALM